MKWDPRPCIQLAAGRKTLMVFFMLIFPLQVGHWPRTAIDALIHFLQNMWPHFVDISSTYGPKQTGQVKVGCTGGGRGKGWAIFILHEFSFWQKIIVLKFHLSIYYTKPGHTLSFMDIWTVKQYVYPWVSAQETS